jgi:hypothetical protein
MLDVRLVHTAVNSMVRRNFFSLLGAGIAAALVAFSKTAAAKGGVLGFLGAAEPAPVNDPVVPTLGALVPVGFMVRGHRVVSVSEVDQGAQAVSFEGPSGEFAVEVCLRDSSPEALSAPARTAKLELFLPNRGTGSSETHEEHGLVAMTLAAHLSKVESTLDVSGLTTLRSRLRSHGPWLISP